MSGNTASETFTMFSARSRKVVYNAAQIRNDAKVFEILDLFGVDLP